MATNIRAIILGMKEIASRKTGEMFFSFDVFTVQDGKTYTGIFCSAGKFVLPKGEKGQNVTPADFPRMANIDFSFGETKDGNYRPYLNGIESWTRLEVK